MQVTVRLLIGEVTDVHSLLPPGLQHPIHHIPAKVVKGAEFMLVGEASVKGFSNGPPFFKFNIDICILEYKSLSPFIAPTVLVTKR